MDCTKLTHSLIADTTARTMEMKLAELLRARFGYTFIKPELLEQAMTHKSYHHEIREKSRGDNERFELLGDAVLDLALTADLMDRFPDQTEGELSKMRASLVNEAVLAEIAKELTIDHELRLGKGERQTGGASKPRLLACGLEALFGALFLDGQYAAAADCIREIFKSRVDQLDLTTHFRGDYKTRLQERLQMSQRRTPCYEIEKEEGPDHDKTFHVLLRLGPDVFARGSGRSKKQAEQEAARLALLALENGPNGDDLAGYAQGEL